MAKNMMKGNVEGVLGSHQQLVTLSIWGNVSPGVSDAQGHANRVFGIV